LALAGASTFTIARPAHAEVDKPATVLAVAAEPPRPKYGYWSEAKARFFLSGKADVGVVYARPTLSVGYGMPHWAWIGVDASVTTSPYLGQAYSGVRLSLPVFDLAFGYSDTLSYTLPFLPPRPSFTRADAVHAPGSKARYWAWEAELVATMPLPHAAILLDAIVVHTLDVPVGNFVYDDSYRVIVANPLFAIVRAAAAVRVLREESLKVGVLTEYIFATGRDRGVVRVGPAAVLQITDHLEALGTIPFVVASPDSLGLVLGTYGLAGFRYRWATSERDPQPPWAGARIP
jgi:hypothetical protein